MSELLSLSADDLGELMQEAQVMNCTHKQPFLPELYTHSFLPVRYTHPFLAVRYATCVCVWGILQGGVRVYT